MVLIMMMKVRIMRFLVSYVREGRVSRASGISDTPQRNRINFPDLLTTINACENICKRWKDFRLNDDGKEVGEIR